MTRLQLSYIIKKSLKVFSGKNVKSGGEIGFKEGKKNTYIYIAIYFDTD